jgi:hypothetical protein
MSKQSLAEKLKIKSGHTINVINPPEGYWDELKKHLPDEVGIKKKPDGTFDFTQLFVKNLAELEIWVPKAIGTIHIDGLLWVAFPKKSGSISSDLSRDILVEQMAFYDLKGVTLISIDDDWSAMRFRPRTKVGR